MTSPILTIPGISYHMGATVLAEVDAFSRFVSPDKLLAFAGLPHTTYQSDKLDNIYPYMYAFFKAAKYVRIWNNTFAAYLAKKGAESQH